MRARLARWMCVCMFYFSCRCLLFIVFASLFFYLFVLFSTRADSLSFLLSHHYLLLLIHIVFFSLIFLSLAFSSRVRTHLLFTFFCYAVVVAAILMFSFVSHVGNRHFVCVRTMHRVLVSITFNCHCEASVNTNTVLMIIINSYNKWLKFVRIIRTKWEKIA